jgi:hypothetical protein
VTLRLQQNSQLDFTVGSGSAEKVTVVAEAPLVDRLQTAGELRVSSQQVDALPLSGRVFTDLALLDSSVGAAAPGNYFGERGSVFTVNGQSGRSNSFLVDGLENNDQTSGTALNAFYSQEVIQEFVLLTHQYSPEFGRASGGVLNIVTRRGANQLTWNVFVEGSSSKLNASGDFVDSLPDRGISRDAVGRLQTGFSVGGPIKKDRAFYFVAYEHQDSTETRPFTAIDREGVAGGRVSAPSGDDNLFVRTDFNLGARNSLMLRLTGDERSGSSINVGGLNSPEWGFRIDERDINLAASLTTVVSSSLINEVRLLLARSSFDQFANSSRPGVTRPSGNFGGNNLNRQVRDEDRVQLVENLTWRRGDHTMKFGIDVATSHTKIATDFNPNGNFTYETDRPFEPGDCGGVGNPVDVRDVRDLGREGAGFPLIPCEVPGANGDGDAFLNEPADISTYPVYFTLIEGSPRATLNDTRVGIFAQDRWEVGSRLLLDYGLRYDFSTFKLPDDTRVDSTIPNGGAGRDYDNLAPRFGFTFTPRAEGSLLFRGGGGIFYDKLVLGFPAVAAITSETEIGLMPPQGLTFEVTEDLVEDLGIDAIPLFFPPELVLRFSTGTELDTPYTVQFNLGVEMALGKHAAFGANVVRAQGYHLPLMVDLNPVVDPSGLLPVHRDRTSGSIAAIVTEGRSWYSALETNLRWQRDDSWFSASYTWSKAEDQGFDPLKGGIVLPPDSDNLTAERGRTDSDRRHRVVLSGDVGLPWMGLRSSGVLQWSTGLPFDVTTGTDDNRDGILSDRPPGVRRNAGEDANLLSINRTAAQGPISALNEPSFSQFDLRLYKPFLFNGDRGKGEVFVQIFNLFDRVNEGQIEGRVNAFGLGRAVGLAGPPRVVGFGMRVGF